MCYITALILAGFACCSHKGLNLSRSARDPYVVTLSGLKDHRFGGTGDNSARSHGLRVVHWLWFRKEKVVSAWKASIQWACMPVIYLGVYDISAHGVARGLLCPSRIKIGSWAKIELMWLHRTFCEEIYYRPATPWWPAKHQWAVLRLANLCKPVWFRKTSIRKVALCQWFWPWFHSAFWWDGSLPG